MEFKVNIDTTANVSSLGLTEADIDAYANACLVRSCKLIQRTARKEHGFTTRTGRLERAVQFMVNNDEGTVYLKKEIASYGTYVHEPTGSFRSGGSKYTISARNSRNLYFFFNRLGKFVSRKSVMHPGSKAYPFLYDALDNSKVKITRIFNNGLKSLLSGG